MHVSIIFLVATAASALAHPIVSTTSDDHNQLSLAQANQPNVPATQYYGNAGPGLRPVTEQSGQQAQQSQAKKMPPPTSKKGGAPAQVPQQPEQGQQQQQPNQQQEQPNQQQQQPNQQQPQPNQQQKTSPEQQQQQQQQGQMPQPGAGQQEVSAAGGTFVFSDEDDGGFVFIG
ncbi:hypothetical protein HDU76_012825 [Blyttiomyces sp. JEL0837]|nr:hypothetical protein HDU76_012825 [Blyttiomyces sp. JEL0837]